ncbi:hypothetical protein [Massilia sp. KIM]|uniref:hypothetical protein n=1 Tax=Massilia sp. KIM TaxID=1955422 RepID=UPI001C4E22C3|nr:hypothetical protein [Massilia sp. KIM]
MKIENGQGYFRRQDGEYSALDKISKDDLLNLIDWALSQEIQIDAYDEVSLKNQAHQIIYKSIGDKLIELTNRREEFRDDSAQLFQAEYEKYRPIGQAR